MAPEANTIADDQLAADRQVLPSQTAARSQIAL